MAAEARVVGVCDLCGQVRYDTGSEYHTNMCVKVKELEEKVARLEEKLDDAWSRALRAQREES